MRAADGGRTSCIAVSGLVETFDQVTSLLKFNRQEERRRSVDALQFAAGQVVSTRFDVVGPETNTARVGLAIQKVEIVLPYKKARDIAGIGTGRTIVIDDRHGRR